jgi:NNP family nitrate/nitrite transporter-like MFS transporter
MTPTLAAPPHVPVAVPAGGTWIDAWHPEDEAYWEGVGRTVARRNLLCSIFAEHVGFSVWLLFSVLAAYLPFAGFAFSTAAAVRPGRAAQPGRRAAPAAVHVPAGPLRRPQLGGDQDRAPAAARRSRSPTSCSARTRRTRSSWGSPCSSASVAVASPPRWRTSTSSTRPPRRASRSASTPRAATSVVAVMQFLVPMVVGAGGLFGLVRGAASSTSSTGRRTSMPRSPIGRGALCGPVHEQPAHREDQRPRGARALRAQAHLGDGAASTSAPSARSSATPPRCRC